MTPGPLLLEIGQTRQGPTRPLSKFLHGYIGSFTSNQQCKKAWSLLNPLTPRCAEFSHWLQCHTIYRKKMKKDRKLHILPFLWSLFRMAQSEFSNNDAKPFIFPKIPKKTLFLGYDFFFNLNFKFVIHTQISNNFGKPHNFGIFFSKTTLVIKKTSKIILILNFA